MFKNKMRMAIGGSVAALLLGGATVHAAPPAGYINAADVIYGGGYNTIDATAALQAAINTGNNVYVPYMGSDWIVSEITLSKSNQTILFDSGVVVSAKSGAFTSTKTAMFSATGVSSVTLSGYGAILKMNKDDYIGGSYLPSEGRHGIAARSVSDFQINGLTLEDTGGDGIYLGVSAATGIDTNTNVQIKDVRLENNYRNGISVISANGLLIDNTVVLNTNGTNPQAGLDLEPNDTGTNPRQVIKNVTVKNSIFAGNVGNGIMFDLNYGTPDSVTATVENVTVLNNGGTGISLRESLPGLTVKDSIIVDNSTYGAYAWRQTGSTVNTIDYSYIADNHLNNFNGYMTMGAGAWTSLPGSLFYSTDPDSPYFLYLDPAVSDFIAKGASDGGYMGARPIYQNQIPEPASGIMLLGAASLLLLKRSRTL